ncbi:hypothetical protein HY988_05470 [Candidatus Micrarchaeota archaeon]|nr:hypothetical protein [Candidatus Micrarchaeota archaeon]
MMDAELDKSWKDTCRILFGQEIGSLGEYEKWLGELVDLPVVRKSSISGKEVIFSTTDYSEKAKAMSLDEVDVNKKFPPLTINEIKDIDSIVAAVQDRIYYTGNMILGNSKYIQSSSNINDSFYIYNSTVAGNCKNMAFCTLTRADNCGFGGNAFSQCDFCLKCHELTRVKRSFELWMSQDSADCYYSHGLKNCANCFFSFNLENKKYAIGNLEIGPEKYKEIKTALQTQMVDVVKKAKRLPSLVEIVANAKGKVEVPKIAIVPKPAPATDKSKIEEAFGQTMQIILKKRPAKPIDHYEKWLVNHTHGLEKCKSAASCKEVYLAAYGNYSDLPKSRLLNLEESKTFGAAVRLTAQELEGIDLKNAGAKIGKIAFFNTDIQDGQYINDIECTITIDAVSCYRAVCAVYSKYVAYSFWPRSSQYIFGCDSVFDSSFCVNCYHSVNLQRCFEMESCSSCSDAMFCHNCENLQECMFCFNTKNKRYAIGNVELGRESYMKIKDRILEQINSEIEKSGKLRYDIFSL